MSEEQSTELSVVQHNTGMPFASTNCAQICAALAVAQGKFRAPKRSKTATIKPRDGGVGYSFAYAPLEEVIDAVREGLAEASLSRQQYLIHADDGYYVRTIIWHSSGEWIASDYPVIRTKEGAQGFASGVTYARRYGLSLALGLAPEDDDDANVADGNTIVDTKQKPPQQRKPKEPAPNVMQQPPQQPKEPAPDPKTVEWDQRLHQMVQNAEPGNAREALKTILDTLRRAWRDLPTEAKHQLIPSIEKYTILAEAIDHEHERTHAGV